MATIYNYFTLISPKPAQYGVFPEFKFGYNTGRVINRIYLPIRFGAAKYYFDGTHGNLEGIAQIDEHGQSYCDVNFNDGEIGIGTVTFTANGETATLPYRLIATPVYETIVDVNDIDISGLVTEQTFNNTVAQLNQTISDGDTANRTAIDQLTAQTNQKFSDVNAQLQSAVESVGALDAQVRNLASEVDGYAADIAKAIADATDAKSIAEGAADDAATADAAAKEVQDSVSALDTRVGAVENSVETAETTANEAKSAAQTAQTTAGEAQTAAANAKSRADEAYTIADTAKGKADTASNAASAAQSTADGVKTRVDTIEQTTIPGINAHVEALQAGEETLSKSIDLLSQSVDAVEENYNTLSDSVGLLTTQVEANTNTVDSVNTRISTTTKSLIGFESGSPSLLSPYTLGTTVELTQDQIEAFGFGPSAPKKLGWSEFSIKPVIKPPTATGDRSYIVVSVTFNQDVAGGFPEATLSAVLSGFFMGDEVIVWRYFHEIGVFVPYFKSSLIPGSLESAGIQPRVMTGVISGNMYTRPNFSQQVSTIHISTRASDNLSFNGGFSLNRYNVPPYFTE